MKYLFFILIFGTCKQQLTITLDGSNSHDFQGKKITVVRWSQIDGPASTIDNPTNVITTVSSVKSLGNYLYELTGWDDRGNFGKDTVKITIQ